MIKIINHYKYWILQFFFGSIFLALLFVPVKVLAQSIDQQNESQAAENKTDQVETNIRVHVFASKSCPHCHAEAEFFKEYKKDHPELIINFYYLEDGQNTELFQLVTSAAKSKSQSVPFTIIGDQILIGFDEEGGTSQLITQLIEEAKNKQITDVVVRIAQQSQIMPVVNSIEAGTDQLNIFDFNDQVETEDENSKSTSTDEQYQFEQQFNTMISIPFLGKIDTKKISLPVLSIIIGLLDGFNPCAMWTLMFLITLLIGLKDRRRMWLLGITFIIASAFVYFLFMAAWLNFFLFIGLVVWVRLIIGFFALGAGIYYLKEFITNKDGACQVDLGGRKKRIFDQLKEITMKKSMIAALIGIILLSFAVNLVELICSAGLPALFTNILSISQLPHWQYYFYLFLYIFFFMLDDIVIFAIAMSTMQIVGLNSKYSHYSHLIGGIMIILMGIALIFKPSLLSFGS